MLEEQKKTVDIFRKYISREFSSRLIIYGTGINAQAVVENCRDYPIEGIMDITKTGQSFCGFPVLSPEEILERQVKKIVVVARPAVHAIIYKRIEEWCRKNSIEVYDIYGVSLEKKIQIQNCNSPYFDVSYESLLHEIDVHEVVSFDIFDTVLMRRVYEPTDVFSLVDLEVGEMMSCSFSEMRREAERELQKNGEANICQIYRQMEEKYDLAQKTGMYLMKKELKVEQNVLTVREKMLECIDYCKKKGKRFYFVSDMYLPSYVLEGLLAEFDITGYEGIIVSCEHGISKPGGLFRVLKENAKGKSYLHIGDNEVADRNAAEENGVDAFLVMSAERMMEISTYKEAMSYVNGLSSRVMVGMLCEGLFSDPFALHGSQGKPMVDSPRSFGYLYLAPLLLSFLVWMFELLEGQTRSIVLFSARDGWFVQQVYHTLAKQWRIADLPRDEYFMVSRKAILQAVGKPEGQMGVAYKKYLDSLELKKFDTVYFFDFMSRGTCQRSLEKLLGREITGLYFQKSVSRSPEKNALNVKAYFKEQSAQDNSLRIFAMCDFLECIFTSYRPSFAGIDERGNFLYEEEKRSSGQIACLKEIHKGMLEYCRRFSKIMCKRPGNMPEPGFCDEFLKYTDARFSRIEIPVLKEFMLDDWLGGDKNTGRDILG